jgi:hypothetical protein
MVHVRHGEISDSLVPEGGDDVVRRDDSVVLRGTPNDLVANDIIQPTVKELTNFEVPIDRTEAVVDLTAELLEFPDDFGARLARYVLMDRSAPRVLPD